MELKLAVDDREIAATLAKLRATVSAPVLGEILLELAQRKARNKLGKNFGESVVARSVELDLRGDHQVEVYSDNPIAIHVHTGGPIRSRNGKKLAIPLPNESTAKYNPRRTFARDLSVPLLAITSKKGNRLLFRDPGKNGKLEPPLFVLKSETKAQKPRQWFPSVAEAQAELTRFINEEL